MESGHSERCLLYLDWLQAFMDEHVFPAEPVYQVQRAERVALSVVDRAVRTYGGAGVSPDTPLAGMWAGLRTLRIADGPDEVHLRDIARLELKQRLTQRQETG
jgi:hypothetical protein